MIYAIALWFWIMENNYYGWNHLPQSDSELIADGLVLLIVAIGIHSGRKKSNVDIHINRAQKP